MIERTEQRFDIKPERLAGDTAYGSGANLNWLVNEAKIAPHIPVVDKSKREDGTFSRVDFTFNKERDAVRAPQTYFSARSSAAAWAMRCPVRVHASSNRAKPPQARKARRPTTAGHRGVLCVRSAEFGGKGLDYP